jgi:hypothetical protein
VSYLRPLILEETLAAWEQSPEFRSVSANLSIDPQNRPAVLLQTYKQSQWESALPSRFISRKAELDRVLFSAIQVQDLSLAKELYCRLQEKGQSFAKLAIAHSDSPAAKRGGSIGPISLLQLHPLIQHHLRPLKDQQLSPIFPLDNHYVILRLDRKLSAQFDGEIQQQLLDEMFEEWLQQEVRERIGTVRLTVPNSVIPFPHRSPDRRHEIEMDEELEFDPEPSDMIAPTSSFFFPKISPTGELIPPNGTPGDADVPPLSSSFFSPQESPTQMLDQQERHQPYAFAERIVGFFVFFLLFLGAEMVAFHFLNQLITPQVVQNDR